MVRIRSSLVPRARRGPSGGEAARAFAGHRDGDGDGHGDGDGDGRWRKWNGE